MDKGPQQEEVEIAYSIEEKVRRVQEFIELRYQRLAKVKSYRNLMPMFEANEISFLTQVKQSGKREIEVPSYPFGSESHKKYESFLLESDVENYFEWLVAVVIGSETKPQHIIRAAYEQIFRFILILGDNIEERVVDSEKDTSTAASSMKLDLLEKRVHGLESTMTKRDKEITATLELILKWKRDSQETLDKAKEYFGNLVRK